jgi:argininosuccinate lyase
MDKLWSGRTSGEIDYNAELFMTSINEDKNLLQYDIMGNIAYSSALNKAGIINKNDFYSIIGGLRKILDVLSDEELLKKYEDIHSAVESELKNLIGETAGKIHTGRSRNDQIILDEKLFLKDYCINLLSEMNILCGNLLNIANKNKELIIPAYTHLQKAQPVLFSHYLLSYFEKFYRDVEKIKICFEIIDVMPLGSGACSGSGYDIDIEYLRKILRFKSVSNNSMDEVSSRDYVQDLIYVSSSIMIHLSRICEDFVIYNSSEFSFIEISDGFCTGSSIMPQKKNPDILELIRGKSAIVAGDLLQIIMLQKGLPSTYNRDLQEDKKIMFQAINETISSVRIFADLLNNITLNKNKIKENLKSGFLEATDVADFLVKKGKNFRDAHHITGKIVTYCLQKNKTIPELSIEELKKFNELFDDDFKKIISIKSCIDSKITPGGTNRKNVASKLKKAERRLDNMKSMLSELKVKNITLENILKDIKNEID